MFLYGGNIPFVVSLYFASQRIPTACPCCAGSISTIGLAPFCFKSAGLALIWASAVLLWFLALLYPKVSSLSIRRVHNNIHTIFPYSTDKLDRFYNTFKSIQFIFVRQSFFSRASPPLTAFHKRPCGPSRLRREAVSVVRLYEQYSFFVIYWKKYI